MDSEIPLNTATSGCCQENGEDVQNFETENLNNQTKKEDENNDASMGCVHYKRRAKFIVSIFY